MIDLQTQDDHVLIVDPPKPSAIEMVSHPISKDAFRKQVFSLQDFMLANVKSTLDDCTLRHHFAPGCYAREMTIPAGTLIIGKIHKHAHLNIISKGRAKVVTEFGTVDIVAPNTFVSEPGTKRVVMAIDEVIWTTIHVTDETDLEKIEDYVIAKSYDEFLLIEQNKQIEGVTP